MERITNVVHLTLADVLESLGLTRLQLDRRIKDGIYPAPDTLSNNRRVFTLGWLHIAQIRENELKRVLARVAVNKERRKRLDSDIREVLDL